MDLLHIRQDVLALKEQLINTPLRRDKEVLIPTLAELLHAAVQRILEGKQQPGIAFSGGVDSTLLACIAKKIHPEIKLYNVSVEDAEDKKWVEKIAEHFGWEVTYCQYTKEEGEKVIKKVMSLLPDPSVVKVGVGCPEYVVMSHAQKDGCDIVLGGLGSEEIFAGYERHKEAIARNEVHEECWRGLEGLYERDLERDFVMSNHFSIPWGCPFLDKRLVTYAMHIAPELKISETEKKIILREVAVYMGLPHEFAFRPKKAAQYGSGFDKLLGKLAHQKKLNKQEYINSLR